MIKSKFIKGFDNKYSVDTEGNVISHFKYNNGKKIYRDLKLSRRINDPKRDTGKESLVVNLSKPLCRRKKYVIKRLVWEAFKGTDIETRRIGYIDKDRNNIKLDNLYAVSDAEIKKRRKANVYAYRHSDRGKTANVLRNKILRDTLSDEYIKIRLIKFLKNDLVTITREDITPEMIISYRKNLNNLRQRKAVTKQ